MPLKHLPSGAFPHVVGSLNRTALGAAFQPLQPDSCTRQSAAGRPEEILPAWGWEKKNIIQLSHLQPSHSTTAYVPV